MFNQILWTLDNEMDDAEFERLCTDLLGREGYKDIVPIGGSHDRGRDAETRLWKGIKATGGVTFFQYSLEDGWERKLKRELDKVRRNGHQINFYVFVTSQKVTGEKRDKLGQMVTASYNWQLLIYDREWLRHRLEEAHPDLAAKYLGVAQPIRQSNYSAEIKPAPARNNGIAWDLYSEGDYEAAAVELKRLLKENKEDIEAWQALTWCQYSLFRYSEALISIDRAIALREDDERSWVLKACVLTEDGIAKGSKVNLLLARDIFKEAAEKSARWVDHYNYGNVLSALGDNAGAKQEYLAALRYDERQAEVWKNLGAAYFHLRDHQQELHCYDKALAINSRLTEAILSKGVTLLTVFGEAQKGAELIASAIDADDSLAIRWPHVWYWLARAYCELGNLVDALKEVNSGLAIVPHHLGLLNLKTIILSKLWKEDAQYIEKAISFYRFRVELSHEDYDSVSELVRLYSATKQEGLVWSTLKSYIDPGGGEFLSYIRLTGLSLEDYLESFRYFPAYKNFRRSSLLSDYTGLLNEQQISPDNDLENAMLIVCAITFGLACDILANLTQEKRYEAIEQIQSTILNSLRSSLPRLATKLLNGVQVAEIDQFADKLSRLLLVWADIALVEFSRQLGFVSAIFGVTGERLEKVITGEILGNWQMEVMSETLIEINKQLKVFKE